MSHTSSYNNVPGFSRVSAVHNADWSGDIRIVLFPEGKDPDASGTPYSEITIPDGVLPAIFKQIVGQFLRIKAEEAIDKLLDFGNRHPWG